MARRGPLGASRVRGARPPSCPDAVEQIARRVVELLRHDTQAVGEAPATAPDLIDADALARHLGLTRTWVYDNAAQLGAIPVGDGPRPRLRFDLETAKQALLARRRRDEPLPAPETPRPTPRRRRPSAPPPVPLLPIHERRALGAFARRHLRAPQRPLDMPHPARIPTAPRRIILGQQRETPPHRANGRGPDTGDCAPMPAKKPSHAPEHWFGLPKRGA